MMCCELRNIVGLSQIAVADKDSASCLKLRFSNRQILKTISLRN
jgi:hypothetical protein